MKIIWSPLSLDRIIEIAKFIAEDKPGAAEKWIDSVFLSAEKLIKFPQSGRIVPEFAHEEIREIIHGNYRIIYQISSENIEILTVRHGKQLLSETDLKK
jgi:plasmid stabilization system protein ParE